VQVLVKKLAVASSLEERAEQYSSEVHCVCRVACKVMHEHQMLSFPVDFIVG